MTAPSQRQLTSPAFGLPGQSSNELSAVFHWPASYIEPLAMGSLFPLEQPLEVELGSGDGGFVLRWARMCPGRNFLAVERLMGRIRKIDRKGRRANLSNLRAIRIEAAYFLEFLLPRRSASCLHVYFPDPWPKRKHRKYRLINEHFVEVAATALLPGGRVYLRTDDASYYRQMTEVFGGSTRFAPVNTPVELAAVPTDFEQEFAAQGISCRHAAYQLCGEGSRESGGSE